MNNRQRAAFGVLIVGVALTVPSEAKRFPPAPTVLTIATAVPDECELYCEDDCFSGDHDAFDVGASGRNAMRNGGAHPDPPDNCFVGSCDTKHGPLWPECSTPAAPESLTRSELIDALRNAALSNDGAVLGSLVARYPASVTVNEKRAAIQVADCLGNVVAHLPLTGHSGY